MEELKKNAELLNLEKDLQKLKTLPSPVIVTQPIAKKSSYENIFQKKIIGVPSWVYILILSLILLGLIIYVIIANTTQNDKICDALKVAKQKSDDANKAYNDYYKEHFESKNINFDVIDKQLKFLKTCKEFLAQWDAYKGDDKDTIIDNLNSKYTETSNAIKNNTEYIKTNTIGLANSKYNNQLYDDNLCDKYKEISNWIITLFFFMFFILSINISLHGIGEDKETEEVKTEVTTEVKKDIKAKIKAIFGKLFGFIKNWKIVLMLIILITCTSVATYYVHMSLLPTGITRTPSPSPSP
jgi:uncharacterized membrane protein SpoIIM required for sporulation